MKPIPVAFHIGPLEIHTYGIGLALTFLFGFLYFERRLRKDGYRTDWFPAVFLWILLAAIVGARALHVLSHLSYYSANPGDVLAIWHGGLSSFGGLLFAVPTGIVLFRRRCPELALGRAFDLAAPVLMACWAMGRLLGPQLMVDGGGHPTHQWFGMYYAGQAGRRLPVPIFQALEDFTVYVVLIVIEHRLDRWPNGSRRTDYPPGILIGTGMVLWGIERTLDEHLWLGEDGRLGSDLVQLAGIALVIGGVVILLRTRARWHEWLRVQPASGGTSGLAGEPSGERPVRELPEVEDFDLESGSSGQSPPLEREPSASGRAASSSEATQTGVG
jgi:phosphatidylglycerol---prolipoprotein diacylglyceryl transferase